MLAFDHADCNQAERQILLMTAPEHTKHRQPDAPLAQQFGFCISWLMYRVLFPTYMLLMYRVLFPTYMLLIESMLFSSNK
jgi:hypothetical protein